MKKRKATTLQHMILSTLKDYKRGCLGSVLLGTLGEFAPFKVDTSSVYTNLHRMQAEGWVFPSITYTKDRRTRRYKITTAGRRALQSAQGEAAILVRWFGPETVEGSVPNTKEV